jgi:hypothetical protein
MRQCLVYGRVAEFYDRMDVDKEDKENKSEGLKLCTEFIREIGTEFEVFSDMESKVELWFDGISKYTAEGKSKVPLSQRCLKYIEQIKKT